jgi:hypothetical protein
VVWLWGCFVDDEVLCEDVVCEDVVCVEEPGLCDDVVWLWEVAGTLCDAVVVWCVAVVLWCVVAVVVWACVVRDIATSTQGIHGSFMLSFGPRFRFPFDSMTPIAEAIHIQDMKGTSEGNCGAW